MSCVSDWQCWPEPPAHLSLLPGEVHIWCASLAVPSATVEQLVSVLEAGELQRAARFRYESERQRFIVARAILRLILSRYLGLSPLQLRLSTNPWGKPELPSFLAGTSPRVTFNLSHSETLALYAFTLEQAIGVDLEYLRPLPERELEQLAARYFSPGEYRTLCSLPPEERLTSFFRCWTRKEAYVKARGQGLSLPLDTFEVSLAPGMPAKLLASREEPDAPERWSLLAIEPAPSYIGALAVTGHIQHVAYLRWNDQQFSSFAT
ncbi:4'-phosphopantetheinyl transferase family protein [Thermogemmatispora sp.]|uniref:4'-phosphopantetheinyl transferase family protein n=1 Tax=Thermogemmatispora sp. TaxID=1968838 RepID=UPI002ACBFB43|nr:4'-phosphopantetheinyl transferase superfamily protein [Thermogemmatispora sp.]